MLGFNVIVGSNAPPVTVRRIGPADIRNALAKGTDDFLAKPSHLVFLGLIYPLVCLSLWAVIFTSNALPLLYPLVSGFTLLGPIAAVGLYEISRQRELGQEASWVRVFDVRHARSIPSIMALGLVLTAIFLFWLMTAQALYESLYGPFAPQYYAQFIGEVLTTQRGWTLILLGNAIGFVFAVVVLSISVISFPLLLDRHVGTVAAIHTSVRAVLANPVTMAIWGLIVAALMLIGSLTMFVGFAVIIPILGHSTWHLYRSVVEPPFP